jgi:hypothetical protein
MPVDLKLWSATYNQGALPAWPCPECKDGRLSATDKSVKVFEPAYSKAAHGHEAWDPDWVTQRFLAVLKCSNAKCGEIVIVSGDTEMVEDYDDEFGHVVTSQLRPQSVFPAPHIINIPEETPREISKELRLAFQLFWSDLGASATRLRTSAERLLDNFGIAKTRIDSKRKRRVFLALASRIEIFKKKNPEHAEGLEALRHVGNLGTHSNVSRQSILAGFEVYEEGLAEIYGRRSKKIAKLRKKLIKGRGKIKS